MQREDFCSDDPRSSIPSWAVEGRPDVKERHSPNESTDGFAFDLGVGRQKPNDGAHSDGSTCAPGEEQIATSYIVDEEEAPKESDMNLHHAEDTSG